MDLKGSLWWEEMRKEWREEWVRGEEGPKEGVDNMKRVGEEGGLEGKGEVAERETS